MDFALSEEQRLLADSVARLLADHAGFVRRREHASEPEGWSRELWARYADLGLLGLPFAEADGGVGAGPTETMLVMEAFGGALVLEPYLASVVLAGTALGLAGSGRQRAALLPPIARGEQLACFAHTEREARHTLAHVATSARREGEEWVLEEWELEGAKHLALHGDSADTVIVSARLVGGVADPEGIGLFVIPATAAGLRRHGYRLRDWTRAADLRLDQVRLHVDAALGKPGDGFGIIEQVIATGIAAVAAEAVGAMAAMHAMTIDYLKTRQQFGRPIGQNQAVQHRAVEMLIALEQARSMAILAASSVDEPDPAERRRTMSMVKAQIGTAARLVGETAIQLHGGIGMTEEYAVAHYLRRLMMIEQLFGDTNHHLGRLAAEYGSA
jgi:alkylation response protein AidB-like acyl-CoA dehydrogenase